MFFSRLNLDSWYICMALSFKNSDLFCFISSRDMAWIALSSAWVSSFWSVRLFSLVSRISDICLSMSVSGFQALVYALAVCRLGQALRFSTQVGGQWGVQYFGPGLSLGEDFFQLTRVMDARQTVQ
ncbi:hypothetical protein BpHYR1_050726 [Brachionus plicatilis]|uniref:Uncharacterized protein n=1 Tax=Brachionus plicatilis TaxID=10195 RepID=A0A3M7PGN2_BRAPC|nr:hypothetical protein BpHYR1_050726 [Brachionus plicatilis]